jgi:hypothetical protein
MSKDFVLGDVLAGFFRWAIDASFFDFHCLVIVDALVARNASQSSQFVYF